MRVDDDAFVFSKGVAEDNVGGFPPHAGEAVKFLHRVRNATAMFGHNRDRCTAEALCFAAKKAGGTD